MTTLRDNYQTPFDGVERYSDVGFDNGAQINEINERWYAANFVASSSYTATQIRLPLSRSTGDSIGDFTVAIYSVDAGTGKPDSLLASGTVSGNAIAEGLDVEWVIVPLDTPPALTSGTMYAIVLIWPVGVAE